MTTWVRHTLAAYRFNTSCRIPGVGLSNLGAVERLIPACTSRPPAGRLRTRPKMSDIQASNICGAGDVQQFAAWDSDAKTNPDLLETSVGSIISRAKVLAHNCMGLLPVYELPSSKYHYPLATMLANLANLTPERPALIPREGQAHELGLNNLGVRCQCALMAVAVMWFTSPSRVSPVPRNHTVPWMTHSVPLGEICEQTSTVLFVCTDIPRDSRYVARYTHHTWSRIESPDSGNDGPFRQSWIPIVRANRARLMLSLCSVTGVKDPPAEAPGAHP
ncbi:hypothetical protein M405DRAFT_880377 [Rhizopogon salebrosus TDB-379]|nr:hypothetical protein M405DRAFT_880377 [Rhizopogon salebrosus TDB-379]